MFTSLFNQRSLRHTLILHVVLPVVALLGILLALAMSVIADFAEERLQGDLRLVARAVELPLARALESGDREQLYNNLESIFDLSEVYSAYVFDVQGQRLASFGTVSPSPSQASRAVSLTVFGEEEFDQYERISGRDVYSFFLPLFDATGQPNGLLQVTRRRSDIERQLAMLRTWSWSAAALLLLLLLGSLLLAHQRAIGQPLTQLLASMNRVRAGDNAHRATANGPSELRTLAHGLNAMLDAIAAAQQQTRVEQAARQQIADQLKQSESMVLLGQIAGGVAHELGAPLSVVDGRALRLLRHCDSDATRHELDAIRDQAGRMRQLIEQLLSFGRNSREPFTWIALPELFTRSLATLLTDRERVTCNTGPDVQLWGSMSALEQALGNLLRNALQASPTEQVRTGWYLPAHTTDTNKALVCLFVEDQGPGIPLDMQTRMFEPFVTTKRPGEGSGMGLAIVRRIVADHEGNIRVASDDTGTRFELCLPLVPETKQ